MKIVHITQGTPEWHAWRAGGLGGSDMGAIFGISRFKTRYQLWLEKTGIAKPEEPKNDFIMRRGHEVETELRAYASELLGEELAVTCVEGNLEWQRVSLDGITLDGETVVEAKLLTRESFEALRDHGVVPKEYWPQVAHQIETCEAQRCLFVGKNDKLGEMAHAFIDREQVCSSFDTVEAGSNFWQLVQTLEEPEPMGDEVAERDDNDWKNAAKAYAVAKHAADAAKEELESASAALKKLAGDKRKVFGAGVTVTRFPKKGNVDYAKVPELKGVNLDQYRKKGTTEVRITVAKEEAAPALKEAA